MKKIIIITILLLLTGFIFAEKADKKNIYKFYTPFNDTNRKSYYSMLKRVVSHYGDYRVSYKRGHKHAGIDLYGRYKEKVYSIGTGRVCRISYGFPNKTVIVKHYLPKGKIFYSSYKHVGEIRVRVGDKVTEKTVLARLFNKKELQKSRFSVNHLHLEIRKSINDRGTASWASMTMKKLNKYFYSPLKFLKNYLKS